MDQAMDHIGTTRGYFYSNWLFDPQKQDSN